MQAKVDKRTLDMTIIAKAGDAHRSDREPSIELGFDMHVRKPATFHKLSRPISDA